MWTYDNFVESLTLVEQQFPLPKDVPGGMPAYRLVLAKSFLYKFFCFTASRVRSMVGQDLIPIGVELLSESLKESFVDGDMNDTLHKRLFHLPEGSAIEGYQHWQQHAASGSSV